MMTNTRIALLILTLLFLSNCALTNYEIQREYQFTVPKLDNTEKYYLYTKVNYQPVFTEDPKAVGVKKNGYGSETARIYLSEDAKDWIQKALDQELKSAGFNVESIYHSNDIKITLNVMQFFVEPWVGFWTTDVIGKLKIEAVVQFPNNDMYYVRKFVSYDKTTTMAWPDGVLEERIINIAQENIPQIVKEIHALVLSKYSK